MQELISKEAVMAELKYWCTDQVKASVNALPTTVPHEYKVGDMVEYSSDWKSWDEWKLRWFEIQGHFASYDFIRPISEHPDITQARELASRHWFQLTKI